MSNKTYTYYKNLYKRGMESVKKELTTTDAMIKLIEKRGEQLESKACSIEQNIDILEILEIVDGVPVFVIKEEYEPWFIKMPADDIRGWSAILKHNERYAEIETPTKKSYRVILYKHTDSFNLVKVSSFPCPLEKWSEAKYNRYWSEPETRLEIKSFSLAKRMAFEWVIQGKMTILLKWLDEMTDQYVDFLATDRWGGAGPDCSIERLVAA